MPTLKAIFVHPIKSLDPHPTPQARVLSNGALEHDRAWVLLDDDGKYINGKRNAKVHGLRAEFDMVKGSVTLTRPGASSIFDIEPERDELCAWLEPYFLEPVGMDHNAEGGFPDDHDAPGPTVVAWETLVEIASWFPNMTPENVCRRLRPNLIVEAGEAFWEDRLYEMAGAAVRFRVGDAIFLGVNPCQRCIVPTRDPDSGESLSDFQRVFQERRKATLPAWADASRFNHYYRVCVNTRAPAGQGGKVIRVGDTVEINPV